MSERDLMKEVERDPWERQQNETMRAFEAFTIYRDMGPQRGLRKVSRAMRKNITSINHWSAQYGWVERVLAWDDYQDKLRREQQQVAIREMNDRHVKMAQLLQSKAVERLSKMVGDNVGEMSPRDIAAFTDLAVKVERQARGAPTEIIETRQEENAAGRMSRAILESDAAMQKALDLLDEVANDEASKRTQRSEGSNL